MRRYPDWPERLSRYIELNSNRSFSWGTFDCALFANGVVEALTGTRVTTFPPYSSEVEARALMGKSLLGFVRRIAKKHHWERIEPRLAMRGDLLLVEQVNTLTIGVAMGQFALAPGPKHLEKSPISWARMAWRI